MWWFNSNSVSDPPLSYTVWINGQSLGHVCGFWVDKGYTDLQDKGWCGIEQIQIEEDTTSGKVYYSDPIYPFNSCATGAASFPEPQGCPDACAGGPVDLTTGALSYDFKDLSLSGPFGMEFHRWYQSNDAWVSNGSSYLTHDYDSMCDDMGSGWCNSYDMFLSFNGNHNSFPATCPNKSCATLIYPDHHRVYFGGISAGQSVSEPYGGATVSADSQLLFFTVKTWDGKSYTFRCCEPNVATPRALLVSKSDRIGNTQTINRDLSKANWRIISVTDTLGRQITLGYDSSNRINKLAVGLTTSDCSKACVSYTYDTGTNCQALELCSATDPDGAIWKYQYQDNNITPLNDRNTEIEHDLTSVTDPNQNVSEHNSYTVVPSSSLPGAWYAVLPTYVSSQTRGGQNSLTFSPPSSYFGTCPNDTTCQSTITDQLNRVTTYTYDENLRSIVNVTGPACNTCHGSQSMSYTWDPFTRLTSVTDGDGATHKISFVYNNDVISTYSDGTSYVTQPVFQLTSMTEPLSSGQNRVTNYTYYPVGDSRQDLPNIITVPSADTSGNSKTITDTYDTHGLLQSQAVRGYVHGSAETHTVTFSYDSAGRGRLTKIVGPRTDVTQQTSFNYYSDTGSDCPILNDLWCAGQLKTLVRQVNTSKNLTTTYAADSSPYNAYTIYGQPRSVEDPNSIFIDLDFDSIGQVTKRTVRGTSSIVTSVSYDSGHRLNKITLPLLNGVSYLYDSSNNLTNVITTNSANLQEEQLQYGHDFMSQMTSEQAQSCTTPATNCTTWTTKEQETFKPDGFGRLGELDHPCLPTCDKAIFSYDAAGNLQYAQDENHTSANTTYNYDYANRLVSIVQQLGSGNIITNYTYDILDNVGSLTDPNSNVTNYSFDDFGRLRLQNSQSVSGQTTYTYDYDDNPLTITDANNATTTNTYDAINRKLTSTSIRTGLPTETFTWTYDGAVANGNGRLTSVSDSSGANTNSFTYDRRGHIVTEAPHIAGSAYSLTYGYDPNGNRTSVTYADSNVLTYTYDWADRQLSAKFGTTQIVNSATYAPFGPLTNVALGNGVTQTTSYDLRYRPLENKLAGTSTIADYNYAEDPVGNITQIHDNLNSAYNRDFTYDDLNRLLRNDSGSSLWGHATNTYDSIGNLTSANIEYLTFAYVQNGAGNNTPKLLTVTQHSTPTSVGYDAAGNETTVGSATYAYSSRNLLSSGDGFGYSYDWRHIRTQTTGSAGTLNSLYGYDLHMLSESSLTSSAMIHDYVWFAGNPIAQVDTSGGTNIYYDFTDHLGTPILQTKSDQTVYWRAEYEPYGKVFALRAADEHQPVRLPGQIAEQFSLGANGATGKSYNTGRWYRPQWGRYTQPDPMGFQGGSDVFAYAIDNPTGFEDQLGLCAQNANDPFSRTNPNSPCFGSNPNVNDPKLLIKTLIGAGILGASVGTAGLGVYKVAKGIASLSEVTAAGNGVPGALMTLLGASHGVNGGLALTGLSLIGDYTGGSMIDQGYGYGFAPSVAKVLGGLQVEAAATTPFAGSVISGLIDDLLAGIAARCH